MDLSRIRVTVAVMAGSLVLFVALSSSGLFGSGRALGAATAITILSGTVEVRHGGAAFAAASDGELLKAGDTVRTGDDSRAVLTYFEGSSVSIEPNTELTIETADALSDGSTVVVMQQNVGRTWHVVTKLITGGSKYEVKTPASTASVRGTAFQVDSDGEITTLTTSEGTVVDRVPDNAHPGQTIDVRVRAGDVHVQRRNAPVAPVGLAPEPTRKVTITLGEESSLVVDTHGRANGIDASGRLVLQTPGAKLSKVDGKLVITLPDIPAGRVEALVRKPGGGDVDVHTTIEERGKDPVRVRGKVSADARDGQGRGDVDVSGAAVTPKNPTTSGGEGSGDKPRVGGQGQGQAGRATTPAPRVSPPAVLPSLPKTFLTPKRSGDVAPQRPRSDAGGKRDGEVLTNLGKPRP